MRICLVHNYYQRQGGEDRVFAAEGAMLEARGHEVVRYAVHNDRIAEMGTTARARATIWNAAAARELVSLVREADSELVHFHNWFPLVSPAAHHAVARAGVAVVQTLHNYRLLCPAATLLRDGAVCEDCLHRSIALPGVVHRCYRDNLLASTGVATMLAVHRLRGTWRHDVDCFITPSAFTRAKFIEGGFAADRIVAKPNFLAADPGEGMHQGGYALFVGRLAPEKGLRTLLDAWHVGNPAMPLVIVGSGPLDPMLHDPPPGVRWYGQRDESEVYQLMRDAAVLIVPSVWYETFGLTILEAYATGLPVIASRIGALAELVDHERTGLLTRPGSSSDLADAIAWAAAHPAKLAAMAKRARNEYQTRYTASANYPQLLRVYEMALARSEPRRPIR